MDLTIARSLLAANGAWPDEAVRRVRDLLLLDVSGLVLVIACDSNAATGSKPADHLQQDPTVTGYSAAKVPLMEVVAAGATPLILVDNLCCELDPTGRRILEGVGLALAETSGGVVVTGSDETNMPTVQTGVGVTVIGVAAATEVRIGAAQAGDVIACIGTPKNGTTVPYAEGEPEIASVAHVVRVVQSSLASELLPVGSRGVRFEAEQLAATAGCSVVFDEDPGVDLEISAGASTCFLAAVPPAQLAALDRIVDLPIRVVGHLV